MSAISIVALTDACNRSTGRQMARRFALPQYLKCPIHDRLPLERRHVVSDLSSVSPANKCHCCSSGLSPQLMAHMDRSITGTCSSYVALSFIPVMHQQELQVVDIVHDELPETCEQAAATSIGFIPSSPSIQQPLQPSIILTTRQPGTTLTTRQEVPVLLVSAVADVWHDDAAAFELSPHPRIDTLRASP